MEVNFKHIAINTYFIVDCTILFLAINYFYLGLIMEFTDNTPMPYGRHEGVKLANVPAHYLIWLHDSISQDSKINMSLTNKMLLKYIKENMDVLKQEVKNGSSK